jgi:site-specific recombinase XerD
MSLPPKPSLANLIESFFRRFLIAQRNSSPNTVAAYRDAMKLLLIFVSERQGKPPTELIVEDLDRDVVLDFLDYLEQERGNCVSTRNARLTAIRSFFHHVARTDPPSIAIAKRVIGIPNKRTTRSAVTYLSKDELKALLEAPDRTTPLGRRDHCLILFLGRTGARVSECCDVNAADLHLQWPQQVLLRGKGKKERAVPLSEDTAQQLKALLDERGLTADSEGAVFVNARGERLTRHGVTHILKRAHVTAAKTDTNLATKRISPHTLRHTTAMHLLQSGVDLTTIQSWLGHETVNTTHHYAEADLEMKRRALNRCNDPETPRLMYQPTDQLLAFLATLCEADRRITL